MDVISNAYLPGDSRLIDHIVYELKSQGIFDQFRKECIADVDTKPAYQNLRQRVEGSVTGFLRAQRWRPDMNKNQVREMLRKNISESGFLETGVERIVDQVVNPKINSIFLPQVESVVYKFLGIEKPDFRNELSIEVGSNNLLPMDLESVSPDSEPPPEKKLDLSNDSIKTEDDKMEEDESPPFEPIEEPLTFEHHDDNSADSHLSGFSELVSHDSCQSEDGLAKVQGELSNHESLVSKHSSDDHLSIVMSDDNEVKMEISEDSQSSSCVMTVKIEEECKREEVEKKIEYVVEKKVEVEEVEKKLEEKQERVEKKPEVDKKADEKQEKVEKKSDEKVEKKQEKKPEKSRSRHESKEKKHEKERKSEKDEKKKEHRDKSSSKDGKEKERSRDKERKDSRSRGKESEKDKSRSKHNSNSNSKDKTSSKKDSNSKDHNSSSSKHRSKSSSDKDKSKEKERNRDSSKSKTEVKTKENGDSKSHSKSSKSSSHKSEDSKKDKPKKHSSSSKKDDKHDSEHKDSKKVPKKVKDDHYSSKEKKSGRRSTDRDSSDGQSGNYSSFGDSSSSQPKPSTTTFNCNSRESGGNSEQTDTDISHSQVTILTANLEDYSEIIIGSPQTFPAIPQIKLIKPKFASNIFEARRLQKIRKQLGRIEKQNQMELMNKAIYLNSVQEPLNNEKIAEIIGIAPTKKAVEVAKTVSGDDDLRKPLKPLKQYPAKVKAQIVKENVAGSGPEAEKGVKGEDLDCLYFSPVSPGVDNFLSFVHEYIVQLEKEIEAVEKASPWNLKRKVEDHDVERSVIKTPRSLVAKKKKLESDDVCDAHNNNKINNLIEEAVEENIDFHMPLSPAESDKSFTSTAERKLEKKSTPASEPKSKRASNTPRVIANNNSRFQRYSSDDLYKPRLFFSSSRRRNKETPNN